MTESAWSAGTAGAGYRVEPAEHDCRPETPDYGRRPVCSVCGSEHVAQPRRATA